MGEKVQGIRIIIDRGNHNRHVQNRQGEVKNSVGNGEAKGLICMTHGHELRGMNAGGRWGAGQRGGNKGKKKIWDNYNSIINKIYFKNYILELMEYSISLK